MSSPRTICLVIGTRPEAIKLLPLVLAARADSRFDCRVCVTAQHRELLDQVLSAFDIETDCDLGVMRPGQSLNALAARSISALGEYLEHERPDLVLVQGDTTTSFSAALSAFHLKIPVGHVEAGLRTQSLASPWPEEANRRLITRLAALHFAPTDNNRDILLGEGIPPGQIVVTGNTVIDALRLALQRIEQNPPVIDGVPRSAVNGNGNGHGKGNGNGNGNGSGLILITAHRRENLGDRLRSICRAIVEIATRYPDFHFVYPVHLNPDVQATTGEILGGAGLKNLHLVEPLGYLPFVYLMSHSKLLLTDSGGIQEEAPYLGKPVLVMRDTTERPEVVDGGTARVVGTSGGEIVSEVSRLLDDATAYAGMARRSTPFGDGRASGRILDACAEYLESQ